MLSSTVTPFEKGWTPARLRPATWYEAGRSRKFQSSAGTTAAVADSDVVGFLGDLSGNSFDLTSAADDTTRPALQGTGAFPYINFDGSNDILFRTAALNSYAAGGASWFFAMRSSNTTNVSAAAEGSSSSAFPIYSIVSSGGILTTLAGLIRNDANTILLAQSTNVRTSTFDATDRVVGMVDDGVNVTPYFDGVAGTPTTYTARTGTVTVDRFAIGGLMRAAAGSWFGMRMHGFVATKTVISSVDAARLSTYLAKLQGRVI